MPPKKKSRNIVAVVEISSSPEPERPSKKTAVKRTTTTRRAGPASRNAGKGIDVIEITDSETDSTSVAEVEAPLLRSRHSPSARVRRGSATSGNALRPLAGPSRSQQNISAAAFSPSSSSAPSPSPFTWKSKGKWKEGAPPREGTPEQPLFLQPANGSSDEENIPPLRVLQTHSHSRQRQQSSQQHPATAAGSSNSIGEQHRDRHNQDKPQAGQEGHHQVLAPPPEADAWMNAFVDPPMDLDPPLELDTPAPASLDNHNDQHDPHPFEKQHEAEGARGLPADAEAPTVPGNANNGIPNANMAEDQHIEEDPRSKPVASILEMMPDIEPDYLSALVAEHLPTYGPDQVVEYIINHLFENPGYPRLQKKTGKGKEKENADTSEGKGKRKAVEDDADQDNGAGGQGPTTPAKKPKIDYSSIQRPLPAGRDYTEMALAELQRGFPFIPLPYLRRQLAEHMGLYAPAHLFLFADEKRLEREGPGAVHHYSKKTVASAPDRGGKGKKRALQDEDFEEERRWVMAHLEGLQDDSADKGEGEKEKAVQEQGDDADDDDDLEDDGTFIECGCCFSSYPFERMTQCPEAHLFCQGCLRRFASNQLGSHNPILTCMHGSGCPLPFPESELKRLLPEKLFQLYERLKQQKDLKEANLEGLEECPFCDWACIMESSVEEDKLFRCGNEDECGVVSCRICQKKDHLPKTCKEVEDDKHQDGRIAIEEAMTRALMRNCPKCRKAFIKDAGCNKMTCPNCRALSCYVCRKVINGYDHFHQNAPGAPSSSANAGKCPLWESVDQRHNDEVKQAYEKALAEYKKEHPDIEDKDIKVDLPPAPPPQPQYPAGYIHPGMFAPGAGYLPPMAVPPMPDPEPIRRQVLQLQGRNNMLMMQVARAVTRLGVLRDAEDEAQRAYRALSNDGNGIGPIRNREERKRNMQQEASLARRMVSENAIARATAQRRVDMLREEQRNVEQMLAEAQVAVARRERDLAAWRADRERGEQERQRLMEQQRAQQLLRQQQYQEQRLARLVQAHQRMYPEADVLLRERPPAPAAQRPAPRRIPGRAGGRRRR